MNERKDIFERVKYIMKDDSEIKVNCSKLARQLNCDRRTVSRYIDITKSGKELPPRVIPKKTDGFEHIIEEKVKTTAPAIAIYNYLAKEHGYTGSYSTIKRYIHNLNTEKQRDAVIRFETNPGIQAQVDWKESLKCKTKDGETIKFNIFLLILGFSRTKFLNYLKDGRLEISNNRAERSIKSYVIDRKNFLFANTPSGATGSAVIFSLIMTALENNLDTWRYLTWLMKNFDAVKDVEELLPRNAPDDCKI